MVLYDGPDNGLSVLCNGLDSGDIKENKNKKYKKPFKMLEPVCEDILEEENKEYAVKQTAKQVKLFYHITKISYHFFKI
jgi:hypothetical protein